MTLELGRSKFRQYSLPFTQYQAAREEDLARETRQAEEQAAFVAKTEDFIRRNIAGQKTKQAQSRRKMLEKLDRVGRPEDAWARAERLRFRFADAPRSGDIALEATGLSASRGGKQLFGGVDLLVRRTEKVGIVGPNGSGKTTLLKLLAGQGELDDGGSVRRGANLRDGYFDQHLGSLTPGLSAIEEIRSIRGDFTVEAVREYLARFRFYGDDPFRRVSSLSGGERSRLALAKLLLEPRNLLFLDEPTNHLDIFAAEILEEALIGFEGTVVLVSHDRRFLENVTTRVVAFTERGVEVFGAGFSDYEATLSRRESDTSSERADAGAAASGPPKEPARPAEGISPGGSSEEHKARRAASRDLEKKRKRAERLESEIADGEKELFALREDLRQAPGDDWEKLHVLSQKEQTLKKRVDALMTEWERLSTELAALDDDREGR
jgi:ATP-binding cassette subfamily F protein 3